MRAAGIVVVAPKYLEAKAPEPSIRVFVTSLHSEQQIRTTAAALRQAFRYRSASAPSLFAAATDACGDLRSDVM